MNSTNGPLHQDDNNNNDNNNNDNNNDNNNNDEKLPDELDALLKRTEVPLKTGNSGGAGRKKAHPNRGNTPSSSHRKAFSLGGYSTYARPAVRRRGPVAAHRKNMSSISELVHHSFASGNLEPIREDLLTTAKTIQKEFITGLEEMDKGKTGYLEMGITRSLSVLPDNIADLLEEVGVKEASPDGRNVAVQFLLLLLAVGAIASGSTALHMLDGVAPPMKLFWKMTASHLALTPFAFHYLRKDGLPKLSIGGWLTFMAAAICFSASCCLFYTALTMTSIGNAVIYANSQALLLIIGKVCVGERIHVLEGIGVVIAFMGAMLCSKDSERAASESDAKSLAVYGDLIALAAAVAGVFYLTCAKAVRSQMAVTVFIYMIMLVGSLYVLAFMALDPTETLQWNMNPVDGIFGGFNPTRLPVVIWLAIVCNMVGTMGLVRAMEFFDNIIIAVATLMKPLLASMIAVAFHAGILPGPLGWLGNFLVVFGTLNVVYPSMGKASAGH